MTILNGLFPVIPLFRQNSVRVYCLHLPTAYFIMGWHSRQNDWRAGECSSSPLSGTTRSSPPVHGGGEGQPSITPTSPPCSHRIARSGDSAVLWDGQFSIILIESAGITQPPAVYMTCTRHHTIKVSEFIMNHIPFFHTSFPRFSSLIFFSFAFA